MTCLQACCWRKAVVSWPAGRASSRGSVQKRHGQGEPPRGELAFAPGPLVRRRGDHAAAPASASSARGYQGVPVGTGPRLQHEWKELPLAVLVEPSPVSRSHSRAMPTLTPLPQHSERHPGDTQMAPGGPTRVMGRCEAARLHFPITPLAGNSHDDRKKVCGRDSNPPTHPLPPLARTY